MSDLIQYEFHEGVAVITMDDGKLNVMSTNMLQALGEALDRAERDEAIVVLRSGRKGVFSAGFDLKIFAANDSERSLEMVRAGAELALRLLTYPLPTLGVMEGNAFPMGTFLLLACDARIAARGPFRMGLNEVAIGISPPGFAIELARSRLHPAWLSRTVTLGEMYEPDEAVAAGFLDRAVAADQVETAIEEVLTAMRAVHATSHALAKQRLRRATGLAMREAIDRELTLEAYASSTHLSAVVLPGR
ncbi:MAG: crotonase/enoyl-CoA hydratase family protein [Phenylobacterium sp.]|uniref:crotonase/enoyl-CoA hydratase family protein n=1 Tax=Phenylobacterium sp. TaxID=1871053 RepID=UPI002719B222|nr:crotonase/enoyl-CoA hydratase family protein [Phenylobacterium sp.]MDO8911577.1 crotonase/enoyl-CoA hydratase family protein [Phenylobacterium sp.]MDP3099385.1 crotonase/enoyl-CoA hydratase family protein [Phenylobacterium sp.]